MGLHPRVVCAHRDDPAAQVCPDTRIGRIESAHDLKEFFIGLDLVTIESEFIDTTVVQHSLRSTAIQPDLGILDRLQDRLTQKELLESFSIATTPFVGWNGETQISEFKKQFPAGFVLKKRRFGYDGNGTFVFHKASQPTVDKSPFGYIAEAFVPFRRELAFSMARNADGEFAVFPLVETKQVDSRCLWVKGPIKHAGFSRLLARFQKMMKEIDYRGILAAELFETKQGLVVNELAPRVHNSAHYSQDALTMSQFEAHWRGVLNWPLKNPEPLTKSFAMVNLLGETGDKPGLSPDSFGRLHWYGKKENRPGRKMGHINTFGRTPEDALKQALKWRKGFRL